MGLASRGRAGEQIPQAKPRCRFRDCCTACINFPDPDLPGNAGQFDICVMPGVCRCADFTRPGKTELGRTRQIAEIIQCGLYSAGQAPSGQIQTELAGQPIFSHSDIDVGQINSPLLEVAIQPAVEIFIAKNATEPQSGFYRCAIQTGGVSDRHGTDSGLVDVCGGDKLDHGSGGFSFRGR
ncbi:MAG: hypothetical protein O3C34_06185, partial [Proteobacteria bacterium]|nr:hypothetical protein [Pseudomonadota bacterium]